MRMAEEQEQELQERLADLVGAEMARSTDEPPGQLYHYTGAEGALGIISSGEIWATDAEYLNDPSEILYGRDLIRSTWRDFKQDAAPPGSMEDVVDSMTTVLCVKWMYSTYLTCFSKQRNVLSQWRAYSNFGTGYSLGFDSTRLIANVNGFHLLRVEYCLEGQRARILSFFRSLTSLIKEYPPVKFEKHIFECIEEVFLTFIVSFKSPAYSEEEEWRLVRLHSTGTLAPDLDFRASRGKIVPHVAVAAHEGDKTLLPLVSVTVGPGADAPRAEKSIKQALQKVGYSTDAVRVISSNIPFRP
jgi:hypothetical protein